MTGGFKLQEIEINLLPSTSYLLPNGTFNQTEALLFSGKAAGVCYKEQGYAALAEEPTDSTLKRIKDTMENDHHSVYDHVNVSLNIKNIPKLMAMLLNNEKQYNTSEKSGRYTKVTTMENSVITELEVFLYEKWVNIFKVKIKEQYGTYFNDFRIKTMAQENARYLVTVLVPTEMIYTVPLGQLNKLISFMQESLGDNHVNNELEIMLHPYFEMFISECKRLNLCVEGLQANNKHRQFSMFGNYQVTDSFGEVYATSYQATLAVFAQLMRHRTLGYSMLINDQPTIYIPPIIANDDNLKAEWLADSQQVMSFLPQGMLVTINEMGTFNNFILKAKERLCTHAQLEAANITKETLIKYRDALEIMNHPLFREILKYDRGARCTFPDFKCTSDCKFIEGKKLIRRI